MKIRVTVTKRDITLAERTARPRGLPIINACLCPVGRAFRRAIGRKPKGRWLVGKNQLIFETTGYLIPLPAGLAEVVAAFDKGATIPHVGETFTMAVPARALR